MVDLTERKHSEEDKKPVPEYASQGRRSPNSSLWYIPGGEEKEDE